MSVQWVEEKDWSKVKVGDRVRVQRPAEGAEFTVTRAEFTVTRIEGFGGSDVALCSKSLVIPNWRDERWDLFVARPTPELPTEPGFYLNRRMELWTLEKSGEWRNDFDDPETPAAVFNAAPFTRLAPEADTARKLLDRLNEVSIRTTFGRDENHRTIFNSSWDAVAAEFGVTEP